MNVQHREGDAAGTEAQDWFERGLWWSQMPKAKPSFKRRIIGSLLKGYGRLRPPSGEKICLVHTGRCGSTVLANMLQSHDDLYWDNETLGRSTRWFLNKYPDAYLGPRPGESPVTAVSRRFWRARGNRFGFEVKPQHLMAFGLTDMNAVGSFFSRLGVGPRIALTRRNVLRKLISAERGATQGVMHVKVGSSNPTSGSSGAKGEFELSLHRVHSFAGKPMTIEEALLELDASDRSIAAFSGPDALQLVYEDDILGDPRVAYLKVVDFLGMRSTDPKVSLRRTNIGGLDEIISNGDAVRARLRNTPWEWMCED